MRYHDDFDTHQSAANRDLGERDPRLDALVTEMVNAAVSLVSPAESESFMAAASDMLIDLQLETQQGRGQLPLDRLAAVVGRHTSKQEFRRAGVTVIPFVAQEGGFVLATAVGPSKQQELVHVAAGGNWEDVLSDVQSAGRGQGSDRYGRSRGDEDSFSFQRRALYTLERAMDDRADSFTSVNQAVSAVNRRLPDITAIQFGLPSIGTNAIRNLALARIDGSDIMGESYDRLAAIHGGIDYNSARTLVAFETGVLTSAIFKNMFSAASTSE